MTSDEIWKRISTIKRDPCAPKDHHIVTNNPYTIDKWKTQRSIYQMIIGAEPTPLQKCVKETTAHICNEWVRYQENYIRSILEYGRNNEMNGRLTMEEVTNDLNEALSAFGKVINVEMKATANMVACTEVTFEFFTNRIASRIDDVTIIRNIVLGLDYIGRCDIDMNYINNTIILYLTFGNERRIDMPVKRPSTAIKKVMFNGPATIVYWSDNTKTIVKCMEGEEFDPEKGLAMAICKRLYGDNFHRIFKDSLKNAETRKGDEAKRARAARVVKAKKKKSKAKKKKMPYDYT